MDSPSKQQQNLESLEKQIEHLESLAGDNKSALEQLHLLHEKGNALRAQVQSGMSACQRTELAGHPQRPYTLGYLERIFTDWTDIQVNRTFGDDPASIYRMARSRT